jgi:hypothetical protein
MIAVVVVSGALPVRHASAMVCPPVAVLQGPTDVVLPIRAILRAHGVASELGACRADVVRASLIAEPGSRSVRLHIEDPFGRTSDRHVSDAQTAASLIESWAVPEEEILPPPRPVPALARRAPAVASSVRARNEPVPWRLIGALEVAGGSDGSLWYGGTVSGCGRIASVCLGTRARIARDDGIGAHSNNSAGSDLTRTATELLILAGRPWLGRGLTLTPMIGLGLGWTHFEGVPPGTDLDAVPSNDLGLRLEVAASAALPISAHVSLVGEVGASWGWSMLSSVRPVAGGVTPNPPAGHLRAAVGCQYSP